MHCRLLYLICYCAQGIICDEVPMIISYFEALLFVLPPVAREQCYFFFVTIYLAFEIKNSRKSSMKQYDQCYESLQKCLWVDSMI